MIDKSKNWENLNMTDKEIKLFNAKEIKRIFEEYPTQLDAVFKYKQCEYTSDFLGFLHVYGTVDVPNDFTVIDFGCNQAVQAQYFKDCEKYIGIDNDLPVSARFRQDNAEYYDCTIQEFIGETFHQLKKNGLDIYKTFAVCSYVPDDEAQRLVADTFPFARVVYCNDIICERKPPVLNNFNCIKLLESCVKNGLIQQDPNNKNNILVYCGASEDGTFKEGWYSCNLLSQAVELCNDGEGQRFLMTELAKKALSSKEKPYILMMNP